jgi:hypothetical protein
VTNKEFQGEFYSASGQYQERDVKIIGPALAAVAAKNLGSVTKFDVVEAARSRLSPLHPYFEWRDATAGEKYRLGQAEVMLRDIRLVQVPTKKAKQPPKVVHAPAKRVVPAPAPGFQRDPVAPTLQDIHRRERAATLAAAKRLRELLRESGYQSAPLVLSALDGLVQEVEASNASSGTAGASLAVAA